MIELHAYAAPDGVEAPELAKRMWSELGGLWPETRRMSILDCRRAGRARRAGVRRWAATPPGPGVRTDADGLYLAGDWVRTPFPSALMERAAGSAMLAVNAILGRYGVGPDPVYSVPPRGLLAGRRRSEPSGGIPSRT